MSGLSTRIPNNAASKRRENETRENKWNDKSIDKRKIRNYELGILNLKHLKKRVKGEPKPTLNSELGFFFPGSSLLFFIIESSQYTSDNVCLLEN